MIPRHAPNRRRWDELTPVHRQSQFYDVPGFLAGASSLPAHEVAAVGPVAGKRLLHAQCHFGLDTLSWARLGATVVGVDFSEPAIAEAQRLATQTGLDARATFLCADVLEMDAHLQGPFDVVFTSHGTITWLSDLDRWARVIASQLAPCGLFYICDEHPTGLLFEERDGELRLAYDYFHADEPLNLDGDADYAQPDYIVRNPGRAWIWSLMDIVSALEGAGLAISALREHPWNVHRQFPSMTQPQPGQWRLPDAWKSIPLMFELIARRAAETRPAGADASSSARRRRRS